MWGLVVSRRKGLLVGNFRCVASWGNSITVRLGRRGVWVCPNLRIPRWRRHGAMGVTSESSPPGVWCPPAVGITTQVFLAGG